MNNPYLFKGLELSPKVFRQLVALLPKDEMDARPDGERFTIREALAHLADWEPIFLDRMKGAVGQDGVAIVPGDEGEMAIANRYAEADPNQSVERFATARKNTISFLESIPEGAWRHGGLHPERGRQTVEDQAGLLLGHDIYHIEQLTSALR